MAEKACHSHIDMKHTQQNQSKQSSRIALFSGVLVLVLALSGFFAFKALDSSTTGSAGSPAPIVDGVQEVRMAVNGYEYEPSSITVTAGQKVRWVVDATQAAGCAHSLISPQIGVRQVLKSGENIIEFTPTQRGTIPFSCSMGMTSGEFKVV